jgi:RNA polymerase sigma factor (sigma-70 family)
VAGANRFATTRWSLVLAAGAGASEPSAREALAVLCETYWYPLYAYLRGRGYSAENAQDVTQAFFMRLLEKHALRQADPTRGRFRSFLLTSLKNFAANERERQIAMKRGGATPPLPLEFETAEGRFQMEPQSNETPERVFDRRWALTLLARVMSRLQEEMRGSRARQFNLLKGYLTGDETDRSYAEAAADLDMTEGAVKVAVHRFRRRFRDLVREEIAHTVSSPEEVQDEMRHLWTSVGR